VWLTKEVANWIVKIRAASPLLPSGFVYYYARLYQEIGAGDSRQLDLLVGLGIQPRLKDSTDKILRLMKDTGIVAGPVGSIDLAIPWSETHPARNPLDVSADSKVTAKPADDSGQPETSHSEE
jgi:hypothetical protein